MSHSKGSALSGSNGLGFFCLFVFFCCLCFKQAYLEMQSVLDWVEHFYNWYLGFPTGLILVVGFFVFFFLSVWLFFFVCLSSAIVRKLFGNTNLKLGVKEPEQESTFLDGAQEHKENK